jgi:hypothetical protein
MRRALDLFLGILLLTGVSHAFDVTQCGQVVPAGETGVLQGDLTCAKSTFAGFCARCSAVPGACGADTSQPCNTVADCAPSGDQCVKVGVVLGRSATLDLAGFALRGAVGDAPEIGVLSGRGRASINGPGEIANFDFGTHLSGRAVLDGLTVQDCVHQGIFGFNLRLTNVTATANGVGVVGGRVQLRGGVIASANTSDGVSASSGIRGSGLTASNNGGHGVHARIRGLVLTGLTANDNGGAGVLSARGGILIDSSLAGNDGGGIGVDVGTERRPRLVRTTCGKSSQTQSNGFSWGPPWGVCTND